MRDYLPLIRKDSSTHIHGLAVYMKEGFPFARDLSLENYRFLLMFSILTYGFTSLNVLLLLPLSITFFVFMHIFDSDSCNIDEVLSINPSANVFVFDIHCEDWLTYFGETDKPGELSSISNYLTQMVNFSTQIPDCDSHSPALLDLFVSSNAGICSTMAFLPLGNSDHIVASVSIDFPSNTKWDVPMACSCLYYCHSSLKSLF